jgi:acetyl esterase/lipase
LELFSFADREIFEERHIAIHAAGAEQNVATRVAVCKGAGSGFELSSASLLEASWEISPGKSRAGIRILSSDTISTMRHLLPTLLGVFACASSVFAQTSADFAQHIANEYRMIPNVTYLTMGGIDLKLDVYQKRNVNTPQPTLVYMHGGFWVAGNKETAILSLLPWMEMGWNVINVEYRLGAVAHAPAALEDCLCSLRFIAAPPQLMAYNIDPQKIVVMGESAGGHLALSLGIIPESAGLDLECVNGQPLPKVAAVINWFGVYDVPDVIDGPNKQQAAERWFGSMPDRMEVAKRVSPMMYVRAGLPPIITIHGDADRTVPYAQAVKLNADLERLKVPHQLITIPGGGHGNFAPEQRTLIYRVIREFLTKNGIIN